MGPVISMSQACFATHSAEERESACETLRVPEVVERRAAGETSGSDGRDQGHQAELWQQQITEGHSCRGPLQVREPQRKKISSGILIGAACM